MGRLGEIWGIGKEYGMLKRNLGCRKAMQGMGGKGGGVLGRPESPGGELEP